MAVKVILVKVDNFILTKSWLMPLANKHVHMPQATLTNKNAISAILYINVQNCSLYTR